MKPLQSTASLTRITALALLLATQVATADVPGVYPDRIVLGQSAAFEGPASALGNGVRLGLEAAFHEANENGGVAGRRIELISYNDGYEPESAVKNVQTLIEKDKVFALIGSVGTPTSKASQPVAKDADVPFIGAFTGAGFLREKENRHAVNLRASYGEETETWIKHLTEDLGFTRIAILYQNDSFGRVGLSGVNEALSKRNLELIAEGTYERNTTAVKKALVKIRRSKPEAVVMVGAYKPIATFIKQARKLRMKSQFVTISFVGSNALAKELGKAGDGVIVTQVVPHPSDDSLGLVKQYHAALRAVDAKAKPGFVTLEGYMTGRMMIEALKENGETLTRESLLSAIEQKQTFDLGGVTLRFGEGDNQGMDQVFLSVLQSDGTWRYVDSLGVQSAEAD